MTASKDDGKTQTDRPGDKRDPASAPAKAGATGSSAITPGAAKPTSGGAASPSAESAKPGAPHSSAIEPAPVGPARSGDTPATPSPAPAKAGATDSSAIKTPASSSTPPASVTAGKAATPSAEPAKPGATGSSAVSPAAAGADKSGEQWLSAQLGKPGGAGATSAASPADKPRETQAPSGASGVTSGAKPNSTKPADAERGDTAKSAGGPQTATRLEPDERLTDGPILDMKAKRIPDPAPKPAEPTPRAEPAPRMAERSVEKSGGPPPSGFADPDARGRGLGFSAVVAAGLLGGIIGAGLVFTTLQWGAHGPRQELRADSPIEARLTALDKRIGGLATRDALTALDTRVAANERALKGLPEAVKSASDRAEEALKKSPAAPAGGGEAAPSAPPVPNDLVARIDALDQRVSALQEEPGRDQPPASKMTATQSGEDAVRLADLNERLKALEVKAEADPVGPSPEMTEKLNALQGRLDAATKANESADQAAGQRLDQVQQAIEARLAAATAAIAAAADSSKQAIEAGNAQATEAAKAADRRLQEQAEKLAALDKTVEGSAKAATVQAALRAIATGRVADALDRGVPYADALASLRASGTADPKQIGALEPYAESGAPTAASLAAAFRPVSEGIAAAQRAARAKTVAETGSVGDRLMSMAESVVQVRRVGGPAPQAAAAGASASPEVDPAARVQDALDRGRIVEAAQAFSALPDDLRGQAGIFGGKLKARADAALAAQALQADAFKALSPVPAGR